MAEDPEHLTTTEARGGSRGRQIWLVLAVSLGLVIAAFVVVSAIYGR